MVQKGNMSLSPKLGKVREEGENLVNIGIRLDKKIKGILFL